MRTNDEWVKAKTEQMIRHQVELVAESQCPKPDFTEGMIQLAYATGAITDHGLGYWQRRLELAVSDRRQALTNERHKRLTGSAA